MLGTTNITTTTVGNTIGSSSRNVRLQIVNTKSGGAGGLSFNPSDGRKYNDALPYGNLWSANSPFQWYMLTDANGICTGECYCRTKRLSDNKVAYRLGDWRGYDHEAQLPMIQIRDKEFKITIRNDGNARAIASLSINTGGYNWLQNIDSQFDLQRIAFIITIRRGTVQSNGSILWTNGTWGTTRYQFTDINEIDDTLKIDIEGGGVEGTKYYFKAVITMQYEYYPDSIKEVIRQITFANHTIVMESNLVPVSYIKEAPDYRVNYVNCWYTNDESNDPDYTSAAIVSQTTSPGTWRRVTAIVEEEGGDRLDWDFNPSVYMTVVDKNGSIRHSDIYCNSFGLRTVPAGENFTFNVNMPNSITLNPYDEIYIDIRTL